MDGGGFILEVLLRGLAVGGFAALGLALWRSAAPSQVRWAALWACLAAAGYTVAMCAALREALGPARWPAIVLGYGVNAYVWRFVLAVFEDSRLPGWTFAPVGVLTALGLYAAFGSIGAEAAAVARDVLSILLSLHGLTVVALSWRGDLVEARRRLRGPFLGVVSGYIIVQTVIDAFIRHGAVLPWRDAANAGALALLGLLGAGVFLGARPGLFPAARAPRAAEPDEGLAALREAMETRQLWRQEGLTIAALAQAVGLPEHRLRRLINDQLGHRNFAAFVNARRIAEAQRILADPARANDTVAAVAFELGFGSLGPFNRAFLAQAGATPRAWRRSALGEESLAETSKPA